MTAGLKQAWGLDEPKSPPSTEQADQFKAAYQALLNTINSALQYTVVNSEKAVHNKEAAARDALNSIYQAVIAKIDPSNPGAALKAIQSAVSTAQSTAKSIAAFKAQVEQDVAAWAAKEPTFNKGKAMIEELEVWGHKAADTLQAVVAKVQQQVNDKVLKPAIQSVEALMQKLQPIYDEYLKQKAAKEKYDPAHQALEPKLGQAATCEFEKLVPMQQEIDTIKGQMETSAQSLDYVSALQMITDLAPKVDAYLAAVEELKKKKAEYEQKQTDLGPKLANASQCKFQKLEPMQQDVTALQKQMETSAEGEEYDQALQQADDLSTKADTYKKAVDDLEQKKKEYEDALAKLQPNLAKVSESKYEKLAQQQQDITTLKGQMETAATGEDYEQALKLATDLTPKVEAYTKAVEELDTQKKEYEDALATQRPKIDEASKSAPYKNDKLTELDTAIVDLTTRMEAAAKADDYVEALKLLNELGPKVDEKAKLVAELDAKKAEYEKNRAALAPRLSQASTCKHEELADLDKQIAEMTGQVDAAVAAQDYEQASKLLDDLTKKVDTKLSEEARIDRKIVGSAQKARADTKLESLSEDDRKRFNAVADAAKSPEELDYLTKALASNYSMDDIEAFAKKINGQDKTWLNDHLKLTGDSNGKGVQQQWSHSCNATTVEAIRGQLDPVYALKLHEENTDVSAVDEDDGEKINPKMAEEQKKMLESKYNGTDDGGKAVPINKGDEGEGRWGDDLMNNMSDVTGVKYANKKVDSTYKIDDAMKDIDAGVKQGHPVPIVIGDKGDAEAYTHYVLITASDPGPPKTYTIHDPGSGTTVSRTEKEVKEGKINLSGSTEIHALDNPTTKN